MRQQIIALESKLALWFCRSREPIWRCPSGKWCGLWRSPLQVTVCEGCLQPPGLPTNISQLKSLLRPLQRLGSSCNCGEIGWEMGWQRLQGLCRALSAQQGPASQHCPAQVPAGVENTPLERLVAPQVKQQIDREGKKWDFTWRGFSSLSISKGRAGEGASCQNKGTGGSTALQAPVWFASH